MPERLECEVLQKERYIKYTYLYLYLLYSREEVCVSKKYTPCCSIITLANVDRF